uniref:Uncharacterized protein n=1 Tax=Timema genevievae TaxID=629358 RepID=A0A7R9PIE6_TIMGE|nr:unnamed protein product [Timema genevievae]
MFCNNGRIDSEIDSEGCGFVGPNMATTKQDIADVYLTPPPRLGQWESCKLFLYDPSEGRVFGRTGASWGARDKTGLVRKKCLTDDLTNTLSGPTRIRTPVLWERRLPYSTSTR